MNASKANGRFQLYYWPIPFRGCFVSYLFAWADQPLEEHFGFDAVARIKDLHPAEQPVPCMGPPMLHDCMNGQWLSQMPAIMLYVGNELGLLAQTPLAQARAMKVVMDCNDLLMEICRYNGTLMWERQEWLSFRRERLPHWLGIFEQSLARGDIGEKADAVSNISVYALLGNMMRCLPALENDIRLHAPEVFALCQLMNARPSLAARVKRYEQAYGDQYCGGQIEASIRDMLARDEN